MEKEISMHHYRYHSRQTSKKIKLSVELRSLRFLFLITFAILRFKIIFIVELHFDVTVIIVAVFSSPLRFRWSSFAASALCRHILEFVQWQRLGRFDENLPSGIVENLVWKMNFAHIIVVDGNIADINAPQQIGPFANKQPFFCSAGMKMELFFFFFCFKWNVFPKDNRFSRPTLPILSGNERSSYLGIVDGCSGIRTWSTFSPCVHRSTPHCYHLACNSCWPNTTFARALIALNWYNKW